MELGGENWLQRNTKNLFEMMEILYTLTTVVVTQLCTFFKINRTIYLNGVNLIVYKLCLNKAD